MRIRKLAGGPRVLSRLVRFDHLVELGLADGYAGISGVSAPRAPALMLPF